MDAVPALPDPADKIGEREQIVQNKKRGVVYMISYIKGKLADVAADSIVIDVSGIGWQSKKIRRWWMSMALVMEFICQSVPWGCCRRQEKKLRSILI